MAVISVWVAESQNFLSSNKVKTRIPSPVYHSLTTSLPLSLFPRILVCTYKSGRNLSHNYNYNYSPDASLSYITWWWDRGMMDPWSLELFACILDDFFRKLWHVCGVQLHHDAGSGISKRSFGAGVDHFILDRGSIRSPSKCKKIKTQTNYDDNRTTHYNK